MIDEKASAARIQEWNNQLVWLYSHARNLRNLLDSADREVEITEMNIRQEKLYVVEVKK